MPKTDINTILKNGAKTKIKAIDYSAPAQQKKLAELRKKCDLVLKSKEVNIDKLSRFIITI